MSLANGHASDHLSRLLNQNATDVEKNRLSKLQVTVAAVVGETTESTQRIQQAVRRFALCTGGAVLCSAKVLHHCWQSYRRQSWPICD